MLRITVTSDPASTELTATAGWAPGDASALTGVALPGLVLDPLW